MSDVTHLLEAIQAGDRKAAADLLPLVYDELRKLASAKMAQEKPGHTLDATALVNEAYLRLVSDQRFEGRGHFFAAAAEAMRRILVDHARGKARAKRGAGRRRVALPDVAAPAVPADDLIDLDAALTRLAVEDSDAAALVTLVFFGGQSVEAAAEVLGTSRTAAYRTWTYTRAWLQNDLANDS